MTNTREKLIDIVEAYADFLDWDTKEEMVDSVMEFLATDTNVGSKWIPVTERLPDKYQLVLAVCKNGKIFVGEYVDLGWRTLWRIRTARDSTKEITQIVTHWMPLPTPPKEG